MVSMCNDCVDSNLEIESDLENRKVAYQIYHQHMFSDNEGYDEEKVSTTSFEVGHVNLRMPCKEEIDRITAEMISQVHSNYNLRN